MAQIRLDLTQFKASGVYTLEFDASESFILTSQIIRLVIGFSRKGPFNAPVYCPDKKTAKRVFGDIDDFLERRGSFFHRSLLACLDYGPVFGLSLMQLNNDPDFGDKTPYQSFSIATTEPNGKKVYKLLASYYNKQRFWYPDSDYLLGNVNSPGSINTGKLFNVVNLGQTPVSIIVKKSKVLGFDVTAREWFGAGKVPTYINEWDFVSDYFVDLIVVEGDWTNYLQLSIDPVYSKYFDKRGLIKAQVNNFFNDDSVNVSASFTGSIIPDLVDGNGINHSLDTIVNAQIAATGVFIGIDRHTLENYDIYANVSDTDAFSAVDMVGHNFADPTRANPDIINFLSYRTAIKEDLDFTIKGSFETGDYWTYEYNSIAFPVTSSSVHTGGSLGYLDNVLVIKKPFNVPDDDEQLINYLTMKNLLITGTSLLKLKGTWAADHQYGLTGDPRWATVEQIWEENIGGYDYLKIAWSHPIKQNELVIPALPVSTLMGKEVALLDATADVEYLTMMSSLGFSGLMHAVINRPTAAGTAQTRFDAIYDSIKNSVYPPTGMAYLPKVGQDILIENKTSKTYYYFKIADPGIIAYPYAYPTGSTFDGYHDIGYGNEADVTTHKLIIPVETSAAVGDAFEVISKTKKYFGIYTGSADYVESSLGLDTAGIGLYPEFVYSPDLMKFVLATVPSETTPNIFVAYKGSKMYEYYNSGALLNGDKVYYAAADYTINQDPYKYFYVTYTKDQDDEGIGCLKIQLWDTHVEDKYGYNTPASSVYHGWNITPEYIRLRSEDGTDWLNRLAIAYDPAFVPVLSGWGADTSWPWYATSGTNPDSTTREYVKSFPMYVYADQLYDPVEIVNNSWNSYKTKFQVKQEYTNRIEVGDYIVSLTKDASNNDFYMLTKVISKKKVFNTDISGYVSEYTVNQSILVEDSAGLKIVTRYKPLENFIQSYQLFSLDGFKLTDYHLPGGPNKQAQLWKILGMLDPANSNLLTTLKDTNVISFRYAIDTFDGGLEPMTGPKAWITRLAKERQKCLAIMNAPSMKDFAASTDPRFTEEPTRVDPTPILNTAYIGEGGNLTLGPSFTFTLPDEFWGSKFCGYFTPYLTMRENGKNFDVPPAAWVSNLYVQKHASGFPWAIVAGPKRGVLSDPRLVGLEYDFLLADRENLEPVGFNPIIKKKGVGFMIFANAMAYQKTHSAFNNLHVRDLLITIETAIEDILGNFLFEFNDSSTRLQIKTMIESYLDNVRTQGGIYDFVTIMDESNNTPDVIDQNVGIVDVAIEPARGIQKFISRITIMKTGGIASGGFTVA